MERRGSLIVINMKIIGAGLNKTGTTTLAEALKILGHNVFDFEEQLWDVGNPFFQNCHWTTII